MKNIDIKSLIIGGLLTSTIFLGVAATSPTDKWDDNQVWHAKINVGDGKGWEPFAYDSQNKRVLYRHRIK
jgi:hypothetical protein